MTAPKMMLNGTDPLARKKQLAARAEELTPSDLCDACIVAAEEFFNQCHGGHDGMFCPTPGGKDGKSSDSGSKPAKKTADTKAATKKTAGSGAKSTGDPLRDVLGPVTFGSVKLNKLATAHLSNFSDKDLETVRHKLNTDQRVYKALGSMGWKRAGFTVAKVAVKAVVSPLTVALIPVYAGAIGVSRWKTKRIPVQLSRVEGELKKRGHKFEATLFEFAVGEESNLPTLAQEIAQAKKELEAGDGPKDVTLSPGDFVDLGKMIGALEADPDEGITAELIKDLKKLMSEGGDDPAKKKQLAAQISEFAASEHCAACLERTEEFFNKCHGEGGRFCGGPGGKGGPGTHRPAPGNYIKQRASTAVSTHEGRKRSASVSDVTTGAVRRLTLTSTAYGSVKLNRLSKTKLENFTDKDLGTVRKQLQSDQRRYNLAHTLGWKAALVTTAAVATKAVNPVAAVFLPSHVMTIAVARWKTRRIPGQISRIERELTKRGQSFEATIFEFAVEEGNFPTLADEIARAKKDVEAGNAPKDLALSADDLAELVKMVDALEVDAEEGITAGMIKAMKKSLAEVRPG